MENCCTPKCKSMKLLIMGIVIILLDKYTQWDLWLVVGVLLILKAVLVLFMPKCPYCSPKESNSKPKRRR